MIQTGLHKPKINITTDENYKSVKKMVEKKLPQYCLRRG